MHYCIHLFTEELPSKAQIEELMAPYNENVIYGDEEDKTTEISYPEFMWDWYQIGGRYCGRLKLKMQIDKEDEYQWKYNSREPREGRLFYSSLLRKIREKFAFYEGREEDYYGYMGDYTYLRVDGAKIKDLLNADELECYGYIDVDGSALVRSYWNGKEFEEREDFDERYKEKLKERSDCFLTVIDIHD